MSSRAKVASCLLLAAALVATLTRTWQAPNDWAEAHWLLDYRFGFVKRGLPGELLARLAASLGRPVDEGLIAAVSWTLCALFAALLLLLTVRIARRSSWSVESVAVGAAFLTSPFVVITGNVMGYHDHVFLPLGIASIWLVMRDRWWTASILQVAALFVHEASALVIYPVFVLTALLRAGDRLRVAARHPLPLAPVLLPLVVAVVLDFVVPTVPAGFEAAFTAHLRQHAFVQGGIDTLGGPMLAGTFSQALDLMRPYLGGNLSKASSVGLVVPTTVALLLLLLSRIRPAILSLEALAIAGVVLLPQALHLIAWDLERLWTYSILLMFLATWIHTEREEPAEAAPRGSFVVPFLAVCCNLAMETPLMGNVGERPSRALRACMLVAIAAGLLALGALRSGTSLGTLLQWRGRSLRDLFRR